MDNELHDSLLYANKKNSLKNEILIMADVIHLLTY